MPTNFHLGLCLCILFLCTSVRAQKGQAVTDAGAVKIVTMVDSLHHPWGLDFLSDNQLLLTERNGHLRRVNLADTTLSEPLTGVPKVFNKGQGGLLDVVLHPDFATNRYVYLSYAEMGDDSTATTALGRGRLNDEATGLEDFELIFREYPYHKTPKHFGSRIVFAPDGKLFLTLGERFQFDPAQDLKNHMGTVVRINDDGSVPDDNPFVGVDTAKAEIFSYGNRNIQAGAIDPATGNLWVTEMGPMGGDEFNHIQSGRNYGWPVVSWGDDYDGEDIPEPPTRPEFEDAAIHWSPTISPSGMIFYTGDLFPEWRGSAMIGGLTASAIVRVQVDGEEAREVERIPLVVRVREVAQALDGSIYVLSDDVNGKLIHLRPLEQQSRK